MVQSGAAGDRPEGFFWCTLTAPGADVLPWDEEVCTHPPDVACSGKLGCQVDGFDAAVFNGTCPRRWSWFVTYLRRRLGDVQFCGVWEYQQRGVLHRHFLIRVARPTTVKRVSAVVRNSGQRWGFGSRFDVQSVTGDVARQAWYVAKYATKTADAVDGRQVLNVRTGELRPTRGFRPWSASRSWGDTMRCVKARQQAFARGATGSALATNGGAGGAGGALDLNSDISTLKPSEVVGVLPDQPFVGVS